MNTNLILLLKRHINSNISEVFIKNLYENDFQFISNLNLQIDNYVSFYYKNNIIVITIDIKNVVYILSKILNLKQIKIYSELKEIKNAYVININTKTYNNNEKCVNIDNLKLKVNTITLKNNNLYELFVSCNIYPQLIMLKDLIDDNC